MSRRITTAIYGKYDPDTTDKTLLKLQNEYRHSGAIKRIKDEEEKYLLEKWYFMRKFFGAENLCEDIMRINEEFRVRWIMQKKKEYYEKNVDKILRVNKKYREEHQEELKDKCKQYNESHREQISRRRGEKVTCECGAIVRRDYMTQHKKSEKHKHQC